LLKVQTRVRNVVEDLRDDGFSVNEIRRLLELQFIYTTANARKS
jgi:DNA-binding transcriptional MerR regulator